MAETMTKKEMFELAKGAMLGTTVLTNEQVDAVVAMFDKQIEQLSKKREPKVNTEAIEFAASVADYMGGYGMPDGFEGFTNKMLAEAFEVSPQKMAAALRRLVKDGTVIRHEPETAKGVALFTLAPKEDVPAEVANFQALFITNERIEQSLATMENGEGLIPLPAKENIYYHKEI